MAMVEEMLQGQKKIFCVLALVFARCLKKLRAKIVFATLSSSIVSIWKENEEKQQLSKMTQHFEGCQWQSTGCTLHRSGLASLFSLH